jgi:hypothetical protein
VEEKEGRRPEGYVGSGKGNAEAGVGEAELIG